jgi:peptide/nickel transport system permease protein
MRFALSRLARSLCAAVACSFLVFGCLELAPGGPVAAVTRGRVLSASDLRQINESYGFDKPFLQRYLDWLGGILHGDLGTSLASREDVAGLLAGRAAHTLALIAYAGVLVALFGVVSGALGGSRGGVADGVVVVTSSALAAIPTFVAGAALVWLFALRLPLFPTFGQGTGLLDSAWHLTLPAVSLALASAGFTARMTRAAVIEEMDKEHVVTATSRGLPRRAVLQHHVFRNAAVPTVTALGTSIAGMVASTVVVEKLFALDGLGSLLLTAVQTNDFPVVQGVTLVLVCAFILINLLVDLSYPLLDPRVRVGASP